MCHSCMKGNFSDEGASACKVCAKGKYSTAETNSKKCDVCPAGYFQSQKGQIGCELCDAGKTTLNEESTEW